jgi:hypothetical protein
MATSSASIDRGTFPIEEKRVFSFRVPAEDRKILPVRIFCLRTNSLSATFQSMKGRHAGPAACARLNETAAETGVNRRRRMGATPGLARSATRVETPLDNLDLDHDGRPLEEKKK